MSDPRPSRTDRALAILLVLGADFASTVLLGGASWTADAVLYDLTLSRFEMPELTKLVLPTVVHASVYGSLPLMGLQAVWLAACVAIARGDWTRVRIIRDLALAFVLFTLGLGVLVAMAAALPYIPIGRVVP